MATSAELRSGFEDELEYSSGGRGLDEFEPEGERAACAGAGDLGRVEVRLDGFEARQPPGRSLQFGMLITASLVVAAAVWLVMRPPAGLLARDVPPAPPPAAAESAAPPPAVAFSEAAIEPQEVAPEPARPAVQPQPRQAAPTPPRAAADPPRAAPGLPRAAIDHTLAGVSQAYRALDAAALGAVWPGADAAVLSRQFSSLKYQSLSFEACQVRATAPDQAIASCSVSISAAAKEGDPSLQHRREAWTIVLAREGGRYLITGVSTRRG